MSALRTFEHNGKTVEIHFDPEPERANPREDDGNLGIMLANGHRDYTLGDEGQLSGKAEEEYDAADRALKHFAERGKIRKCFPRWCATYLGSTVVLPLGLIDHSGISMYVAGRWMSTGDASNQFDPGGWDSGLVGFIFDTATTREENGSSWTPEEMVEALTSEVRYYNEVLTGQVFGYVITDKDGEEIESCWGFIGDDYTEVEARYTAGYTCKHCQRAISKYHIVDDEQPEGSQGWSHFQCGTCGSDITHQEKAYWHIDADGILSMPHDVDFSHRYACANGQPFAETDQIVKEYPTS